jgi:hypothetical protein
LLVASRSEVMDGRGESVDDMVGVRVVVEVSRQLVEWVA